MPACNTDATSVIVRSPRAFSKMRAANVDTAGTRSYFLDLQQRIVAGLEETTGESFAQDIWSRDEGGGGISRFVENGAALERGSVLFSHVTGKQLPASATAHRPELAGRSWQALGVSLVLHPRNPYAPIVHLNVRFFVAQQADAEPVWWFGGGMDLTPCYGFTEDAVHFTASAALRSRRSVTMFILGTSDGATSISCSSIGRSHAASEAFSTTI